MVSRVVLCLAAAACGNAIAAAERVFEVDGLAIVCNDAGWPIRLRDEPIEAEYWVFHTTLNAGRPSGQDPALEERGYGATGWSVGAQLAVAARRPDGVLWHTMGGPVYRKAPGKGFVYAFDALLHARDGHKDPGRLQPSWRTDGADRSVFYRTLGELPASSPDVAHVLYLGRLDTPDLRRLAVEDPASYTARLDEVMARVIACGFDGVCVDASGCIGGIPGDGYPLTDDAHPGAVWWSENSRRWRDDPSYPVFISEAIALAGAKGVDPRVDNRLQGPRPGERFGVPTSCLWRHVQWRHAFARDARGELYPARALYAAPGRHRWLCLGDFRTSDKPYAFAPGVVGAENARTVFAKYGVVSIAAGRWGAVAPELPPRATPETPLVRRRAGARGG